MSESSSPAINLISGRKEGLRREKVAFAKIQFVSIVILIAFIAMLGVMIGIRGVITYRLKTVQDAIGSEELALAQMRVKEEKYFILANKLKLIDDYINAKGQLLTQADQIYLGLPSTIGVDEVKVDVDGSTVGINAQAKDMLATIAYLDQLEEQAKTSLFTKASLQGLGRGEDGTYNVQTDYYLEP